MAFLKVQSPAVALYSGISAAATSMRVTPYPVDLDGNKLTMGALGANPQVTTDPKVSSFEEIIGFTGITDNGDGTATLTGLSRDMASSNLATPGTGKQHGAGAVVIISWNPQDVARVAALENNNTFTGLNIFAQVPQTTGGNPINPGDLAQKSYVDALVLGTLTTLDVIVPGTAGATIVVGKLLYFDTATGTWKLASSSTSATIDNLLLGIAQGAGTSGNPITNGVLLQGVDANQTGLSVGAVYYANDTAGSIGSSAGTVTVTVGLAQSATKLYFAPRFNEQITTLQFAALAGTGTPSGSNKFVTADTNALNELLAHKVTAVTGASDVNYPSEKAVSAYVATQVPAVTWQGGVITRSVTGTSGSVTTAHGLGRTPRFLRITAIFGQNGIFTQSVGNYNGTNQACSYTNNASTPVVGNSTTQIVFIPAGAGGQTQAAIATFDGTNFYLAWTLSGSGTSGTAYLTWEVF